MIDRMIIPTVIIVLFAKVVFSEYTSTIQFCDSIQCDKTSIKPFKQIQRNEIFFIKMSLNNNEQLFLNPLEIIFQDDICEEKLNERSFSTITHDKGFSIYGLYASRSYSNLVLNIKSAVSKNQVADSADPTTISKLWIGHVSDNDSVTPFFDGSIASRTVRQIPNQPTTEPSLSELPVAPIAKEATTQQPPAQPPTQPVKPPAQPKTQPEVQPPTQPVKPQAQPEEQPEEQPTTQPETPPTQPEEQPTTQPETPPTQPEEQPQTRPPQTRPPQTRPPQTRPPQTLPPYTPQTRPTSRPNEKASYPSLSDLMLLYYQNPKLFTSKQLPSQETNVSVSEVCKENQFLYNYHCVEKDCLFQKLVRLTPFETDSPNALNLTAILTADHTSAATNYPLVISFPDIEDNQLLSDRVNCLDWRLYQTENTPDINSMRKYVTYNGEQPTWPKSSYSFNEGQAQISMTMSQADLSLHQCLELKTADEKIEFQCFFELAFQVQNETLYSYYMTLYIFIDLNIANNNIPPAVQFKRLGEVTGCTAPAICTILVHVNSELLFCSDDECTTTSPKPFVALYLNRFFALIHKISDPAFKTWGLKDPMLSYQSVGFTMTLQSDEIDVLKSAPGYNIYKIRVPIVSSEVVITMGATMYQYARLLEGEEKVNPVGEQNKVNDYKINDAVRSGQIESHQLSKVETYNEQSFSIAKQIVVVSLVVLMSL